MPDSRKKRGRHPKDDESFNKDTIPALITAAEDLAWLKSRDYADASSLKLVGDRYQLNARQRTAVARSTCSDEALAARQSLQTHSLQDCEVYIDGFNLLTTIEAALGGGVLLIGRDGCLRDMSSMHGNYRVLSDTDEAITKIHQYLFEIQGAAKVTWYLDKPVSNSGRLKTHILDQVHEEEKTVHVELLADPDPVLKKIHGTSDRIITADAGILSECGTWFNGARSIVEYFELFDAENSYGTVINFSPHDRVD